MSEDPPPSGDASREMRPGQPGRPRPSAPAAAGGKIRRESGFTLLEVMVAMTILGIAVATMMQLTSQSLRLLAVSGEHQRAVLLADRLARESAVPGEGVQTGEEGPFSWERRVALVAVAKELTPPPPSPAAQLFSVSIAVRWGTNRSVELATLRAAVAQESGSRLP